jgi:hypothetical protein
MNSHTQTIILVFAIPECCNINNNIKLLTSYTPIFIVLTYYTGNMFRLIIKSSSGPYIQIQIFRYCVMGSHTITYFVRLYIMIN